MAKGKLSSYSQRKPRKQKTFFGLKVGKPPKSDYQKKVLAGATVFKTGAGGKIATDSKGKISSFTSTPPQQITKKAPHHNIYKPVPKVKTVAGGTKAPHDDMYKPVPKVKIPKPSSKFGLDVAGAYTGPRNIGGKGAYKGYITSTVQPPPSKPKIVTGVKPPSESGSSSSGSQKFVVTPPVSKPTLLRGGGRHGQINKVVKSSYQGGDQTPMQFLKNQTINPIKSAKSIDKALGNVNLGLGQSLSPSQSFKSLMSLIGVKSGTSGNTRGSFSGGVMRNNQTSSASSVQHKQMNPKNYLASSGKTLVSGQTQPKIKMKELTGTNTGVKRNQQSSGKALNLGGSLWSWWKQKGIEQKKKTDQQFYGIQRNLPRNIGNAP